MKHIHKYTVFSLCFLILATQTWNITCVPWWIIPHILHKHSHLCVFANKICCSIWYHCLGKYRRFALVGGGVLLNRKPCPLFNYSVFFVLVI